MMRGRNLTTMVTPRVINYGRHVMLYSFLCLWKLIITQSMDMLMV